MKRILPILTLSIVACSEVPVTDRNQLNIVPSSQLMEMSNSQYQAFMQEHKRSSNQQWVSTVKRVGNNIRAAVEQYMRETGNYDRVDGFDWEFTLVESDQKNAFAMPGGKVVVYEGIMQLIDGDEAELATVMSHEIAHVIAEHGNERMSQQLVTQLGGSALGAMTSGQSELTQQLFRTAYGVGTQVGVLLPYSRTQESEADKLGLVFMAMAGYDPNEAIDFWNQMSAGAEGGSPPEFLSTHPGHNTRIRDIEKYLPQAMEYYRG